MHSLHVRLAVCLPNQSERSCSDLHIELCFVKTFVQSTILLFFNQWNQTGLGFKVARPKFLAWGGGRREGTKYSMFVRTQRTSLCVPSIEAQEAFDWGIFKALYIYLKHKLLYIFDHLPGEIRLVHYYAALNLRISEFLPIDSFHAVRQSPSPFLALGLLVLLSWYNEVIAADTKCLFASLSFILHLISGSMSKHG